MKSWRTLITAGLTAGAAAVIFPLTASPAAAAEPPAGWVVAGGGYPTYEACVADGADYIDDTYHDYTQYYCFPDGGTFTMWVR